MTHRSTALKLLFTFTLLVLIITGGFTQDKGNGPAFQFGVGVAYSSHAGSYRVAKTTFTMNNFQEHNGLRMLAMQFKAGWIFAESIMVNYTLIFTPSNSTISPYSSTYHGGSISFFPKSLYRWSFTTGAGKNFADDKESSLSNGILGEIGLGFEVDPRFIIELKTMFGRMENDIKPRPLEVQLEKSGEFYLQLTANYFFYRNP